MEREMLKWESFCWWLKSCTNWYVVYQFIPLFIGFYTSLVVQDFSHQQLHSVATRSSEPVCVIFSLRPLRMCVFFSYQKAGEFSLAAWCQLFSFADHSKCSQMKITRVDWNFHWLSLGFWCFTGSVRTEGGRYELTSSCGFQEAVVLRLSDLLLLIGSEIPNKQLRLVVEIPLFAGFHTSLVVVWDFSQQYITLDETDETRFSCWLSWQGKYTFAFLAELHKAHHRPWQWKLSSVNLGLGRAFSWYCGFATCFTLAAYRLIVALEMWMCNVLLVESDIVLRPTLACFALTRKWLLRGASCRVCEKSCLNHWHWAACRR